MVDLKEMLTFDPTALGGLATYKLMVSAIVPRPIAFVSTISPDGIGNLAPFSFFNGVSSNPPCLMFCVTLKSDGLKKDTLRNIEATKEFVVNSVNDWITEPMNQCSAAYPYGVDEMKKVGLHPLDSQLVRPKRVQESALQMECKLYDTLAVGTGIGSSVIVVGEIVRIHVAKNVYKDGVVDIHAYQPIARLGGKGYSKIGDVFELERPQV